MSAPVERIKPYGEADSRAKGEQVEAMFDSIAPAYDLMNRMMTLGIDRRWRRLASGVVAHHMATLGAGEPAILDVATGTADLLLAIAAELPGARLTGADLSAEMMAIGRTKLTAAGISPEQVEMVQADSLALPFADGSFDAVTVGFGVRNFADISRGLGELARVLRPGGMLCVLELSTPHSPIVRPFYHLYTRGVIPLVGRLMSRDKGAYTYLPASIAAVPQGRDMTALMEGAGLHDAKARPLTFGVCTLYTAVR